MHAVVRLPHPDSPHAERIACTVEKQFPRVFALFHINHRRIGNLFQRQIVAIEQRLVVFPVKERTVLIGEGSVVIAELDAERRVAAAADPEAERERDGGRKFLEKFHHSSPYFIISASYSLSPEVTIPEINCFCAPMNNSTVGTSATIAADITAPGSVYMRELENWLSASCNVSS